MPFVWRHVCGEAAQCSALEPWCQSALRCRAPDAGTLPAAEPSHEGGSVALQGAWLALTRKIMAHTEDVGDRFAEEARRMQSGEAQERAIRGQASAEDAAQLRAEGIPVIPWAVPQALKETLQ